MSAYEVIHGVADAKMIAHINADNQLARYLTIHLDLIINQ